MRNLILFLLFGCSCTSSINEQASNKEKSGSTIDLTSANNCSYSGVLNSKNAHSFKSDNEADQALASIMKFTGLPTNFLLTAADVDNAAAVLYNEQRYILYSQRFMEEVQNQTHSKYGALSILSHEVGHHLAGHTLLQTDSRPELELEADRFSGFILSKMGASAEEACIAMDTYGSEEASTTHPAKRTRIAAIMNGWKEAKEENANSQNSPIVSSSESHKSLYKINVINGAGYITLRNRSLSAEEYKMSNSGTEQSVTLNKETIITNLPNGTPIEVLSSVNNTLYVSANTSNGKMNGYIVKSFGGKPTVSEVAAKVMR